MHLLLDPLAEGLNKSCNFELKYYPRGVLSYLYTSLPIPAQVGALRADYVECKDLDGVIYLQAVGTAINTSFTAFYAVICNLHDMAWNAHHGLWNQRYQPSTLDLEAHQEPETKDLLDILGISLYIINVDISLFLTWFWFVPEDGHPKIPKDTQVVHFNFLLVRAHMFDNIKGQGLG